MSLNYTTFVNSLANIMVVNNTSDTNFQTDLPNIIDYAEQRIYRELDFLSTRVTDTAQLTKNTRTFKLPTGTGVFLVVETVNVLTPVGSTQQTGTRATLVPISKQFIDFVYPSAQNNTGVPEFFAMVDDKTIVLGPSPDATYLTEVVGTQRPAPLSSGNQTTWLATTLPDLFMAAAVVRACAYQRNWSAAGDDPQMPVTWEKQYQTLKSSALVEELRKMYRGLGGQSEAPSPAAIQPSARG